MPAFAFLPFPSQLVGKRKLRLENDFAEGPTAVAFAADGTLHLLCEVFYNAHRYKEPESNDLHGHYVIRFGADLGAARITPETALTDAVAEGSYDALVDLAVVSEGLLFMTRGGRSWLVDHEGAIRRAFAFDDWGDKPRMYRENLACRACVRPDGRVVIAVAEASSNMTANVLAVSVDPKPKFVARQPAFRYLTSIEDLDIGDDETTAGIPYVSLANGKPLVRTQRPKPTLADAPGAPGYSTSLGGLAALTNEITLVALFVGRYSRVSNFQYALIDDAGAFVASLDLDGDSPYEDHQLGITADPRHGRAIVKTKTRVHVFDDRGRTIARVSLVEAVRKPLAAFHLLGASPAGEILLWHKKHRTLLLVDATQDVAALPDALTAAAEHYKIALAAAKKVYKPVNARWVVKP